MKSAFISILRDGNRMFIDYAEITIRAGRGGNGAVTFRKEKYVSRGGPSGGNGGDGGSVWFVADGNLNTLLDFQYKRHYAAENGHHGGSSLKDGRKGEDIVVRVPVGTIIKDADSGEVLFDFTEKEQKYRAAKGGRGGKGNSNFATPTNQAPRYAEQGRAGGEVNIFLELKLIADIGLVGFPNAGKSTLISVISAAKPKIADYPFTTLEPNLGIVQYKDYQSFTVADIPGIIEGASAGKGLGLQFLRHIERTKALCFLLDVTSEDIRKDFRTLTKELEKYSGQFAGKRKIVALSKADLIEPAEQKKLCDKAKRFSKLPVVVFSSAARMNLDSLLDAMWKVSKASENEINNLKG